MAILVVFGLKGFKHEFASQVALKYAHNCLELLKKLPVLSASAGVTTGETNKIALTFLTIKWKLMLE